MDVAAVDLGNGHVDIITANSGDGTVSVLVGNGDGTFPMPHQDFPVGAQPVALAVGDLNRDGLPDVVTANTAGNSLSVLRGKGDGTFRSALDLPITVVVTEARSSRDSGPVDVAIGDFNGDGKLDLVTANSGDGQPQRTVRERGRQFRNSAEHRGRHPRHRTTCRPRWSPPTSTATAMRTSPSRNRSAAHRPARRQRGRHLRHPGRLCRERGSVALACGNLNGDQTSLGNPRLDLVTVDTTDPGRGPARSEVHDP